VVSSWGCLLYLAFCLSTARLLAAARPKGTAGSEQRQDTDLTAALLQTGWGRLLLAGVGVVAVAAGVEVGRRSVRLDFRERFTAAHMSRALAMLTRALGGVGCAARAVVFVLAGFFIVKAAVLSSAKQAKGLDAVFRSVASSAYGSWLLALLASGPLMLWPLLPARGPLPRPDTGALRRHPVPASDDRDNPAPAEPLPCPLPWEMGPERRARVSPGSR
jgi:hypothetical protein